MTSSAKDFTMNSSATDPISGRAYLGLCFAAAVVGLVTSVGVWLFVQGFGLINRLTLGTFGAAPAPVGIIATVAIPALGGLLVALWMHYLSRPAKLAAMGHIIDGVAEQGGRLNQRNGIVFVIGSMFGIGFGAPVGADTPAAMIGGHFGAWLAQRMHWPAVFIRVLVVAGVAAGISATYFAQLAAIFFAFEVVLGGFGGALFVAPTLIAVVMAVLFTFAVGGMPVQYAVSAGAGPWGPALPLYIGVALLASVAAIVYVNLLPRLKALWFKVKLPFWAKAVLAGALVGVVGIWLPDVFGTGLSQMKIDLRRHRLSIRHVDRAADRQDHPDAEQPGRRVCGRRDRAGAADRIGIGRGLRRRGGADAARHSCIAHCICHGGDGRNAGGYLSRTALWRHDDLRDDQRLRNAFPVDAGGGDRLCGGPALSARLGIHLYVSGAGHPPGARYVHRQGG